MQVVERKVSESLKSDRNAGLEFFPVCEWVVRIVKYYYKNGTIIPVRQSGNLYNVKPITMPMLIIAGSEFDVAELSLLKTSSVKGDHKMKLVSANKFK